MLNIHNTFSALVVYQVLF